MVIGLWGAFIAVNAAYQSYVLHPDDWGCPSQLTCNELARNTADGSNPQFGERTAACSTNATYTFQKESPNVGHCVSRNRYWRSIGDWLRESCSILVPVSSPLDRDGPNRTVSDFRHVHHVDLRLLAWAEARAAKEATVGINESTLRREADTAVAQPAGQVMAWPSRRLMRPLTAIAAFAAGAWGISLALNEAYDSYAVAAYTSTLENIFIAALLVNSLASCWLAVRALIDLRHPVVPVHFGGGSHPGISGAIRALGALLVGTGIGCVLYLLLAIYIIYGVRGVLPWNDPLAPMAPFYVLDVLITSFCACWLGLKLMQRRKPRLAQRS